MSKLTIILTSYNRPHFVRRAIDSMLAQTNPNWRLIIQDDGSDNDTLQAIYSYSDGRISVFSRTVTVEQRQGITRYAYLINQTYAILSTPYVGYMCDNVEYRPGMVQAVVDFFEERPEVWSGYTLHQRDICTPDGRFLGDASILNHWDYTPPIEEAIKEPFGMLDHSQVFHRLPIAARWEEDKAAVKCGDGLFFMKLVSEHGPIQPIKKGEVLSMEHLFK